MRKWLIRYRQLISGGTWCTALVVSYFDDLPRADLLIVSLLAILQLASFAFQEICNRRLENKWLRLELDHLYDSLEKISLRIGENLAAGKAVLKPDEEKAAEGET